MLKPGWSQRQYEKVKADLDQLPEWFKRSVMAQEVEPTTKKSASEKRSEQRNERQPKNVGSRR